MSDWVPDWVPDWMPHLMSHLMPHLTQRPGLALDAINVACRSHLMEHFGAWHLTVTAASRVSNNVSNSVARRVASHAAHQESPWQQDALMNHEATITSNELVNAPQVSGKLKLLMDRKAKDVLLRHGLLRNEPARLIAKDMVEQLEDLNLVVHRLVLCKAMIQGTISKGGRGMVNQEAFPMKARLPGGILISEQRLEAYRDQLNIEEAQPIDELPKAAVGRDCAGNLVSQSDENIGRIDALKARLDGWQRSLVQDYLDQGLKLSFERARPTPSLTKGGPCCAQRHAPLRACERNATTGATRLAARVATCFATRYATPLQAMCCSRRNMYAAKPAIRQ